MEIWKLGKYGNREIGKQDLSLKCSAWKGFVVCLEALKKFVWWWWGGGGGGGLDQF